MKKIVLGVCMISFLLTSCSRYAKESDLDCIKIGMKKEKVMDGITQRGVMRGSLYNKYGDVIEVREYQISKNKDASFYVPIAIATLCTFGIAAPLFFIELPPDTYWMYFCNDKLIQWGKAGDWKEAERIVWDININKV